jgi:hypothetical protein
MERLFAWLLKSMLIRALLLLSFALTLPLRAEAAAPYDGPTVPIVMELAGIK